MRTLISLSLALALAACNSGKGDVEGDGTDGADAGDGADGGGQDGSPDGESPWIEDGVIYCQDAGENAGGWAFFVEIEADDPQSRGELADFGGQFTIYDSSGEVEYADENLVCDSGECVHSVREEVAGVSCTNRDDFRFVAQVEDIDGNLSEEFELEWRD